MPTHLLSRAGCHAHAITITGIAGCHAHACVGMLFIRHSSFGIDSSFQLCHSERSEESLPIRYPLSATRYLLTYFVIRHFSSQAGVGRTRVGRTILTSSRPHLSASKSSARPGFSTHL